MDGMQTGNMHINRFGDIARLDGMRHDHESACITGFSNIIGQDKKMKHVFRNIMDVAPFDYPVHVFGETGTGKELVARAIHDQSLRKNGPFVPINCGALPEGLVESELFGHVKGAFSGAIRNKKGRFELAHGGTIFLDEVAELSKYMQVKLLRFLQDGVLEKVGSEQPFSVNVRVISATNKDLRKDIAKGTFREDLFYRLNVFPIQLPQLGERIVDIPLLANYFLKEAAEQYQRPKMILTEEAMALLTSYRWPGNVRELQNAIQFAFVRSNGVEITAGDLPEEITDNVTLLAKRGISRKLDFDTVKNALIKAGGNKAKTARQLGVGRATLYRFLHACPEAEQVC